MRRSMYLNIFLLFGAICTTSSETVKIKQGILNGALKSSRNGIPFHAFYAIPYAEPPVDGLRLKDPVPHSGWKGVRDATVQGSMCCQDMPYFPEKAEEIYGQEDCLILNVYTPTIDHVAKLAVMVFIHGGGFAMGDAGTSLYDPEYLMDKNIVLVSIQYRLGALGFLSFGDENIPGNFGLKDQTLALKWVQNNIHHFGGDASSVTIFGESAGAASVHFHLVSPLSKGLFQKAILQSGTAACTWAIIPEDLAKDRAAAFATLLGCPTKPTQKVWECLRTIRAKQFVTVANKFFEWGKTPMIRFGPVIETHRPIEKKFLPKHPLHLPHSPIPIIIGVNNNEGGIVAVPMCADDFQGAKELNEHFNRRILLALSTISWIPEEKRNEVSEKMKEFYFKNKDIQSDNIESLVDMTTDIGFVHGSVKTALHHKSIAPIYFYLYNYQLPISFNVLFGNCSRPLGVSHADELLSLFKTNIFNYTLTEQEAKHSNFLLDLWTNFAKTGAPHKDWSPLKSNKIEYFYLDNNEYAMKNGLLKERLEFVNSLPLLVTNMEEKKQKNEL